MYHLFAKRTSKLSGGKKADTLTKQKKMKNLKALKATNPKLVELKTNKAFNPTKNGSLVVGGCTVAGPPHCWGGQYTGDVYCVDACGRFFPI